MTETPDVFSISELFGKKEELHSDLQGYVQRENGIDFLRHPLVIAVFYTPEQNALYNAQYKARLNSVEKYYQEKNWPAYIWMHERPYRLERLASVQSQLTDTEYWELLSAIWTDSENLWQYRSTLDGFLNARHRLSSRHLMMNEEEKQLLATLPEKFVIYRGHHKVNRLGHSWTLSYFKAKWFAHRWQKKNIGVVQATIQKSDVVALLLGRNEFEIVVSPKKLTGVKAVKQQLSRPEWMEEVKTICENVFVLKSAFSYHGPWHWQKVEYNALQIVKRTKGADKTVVQLFALIHDCKRENENHDPEHGHRAALFAKQLFEEGKLLINKQQLEVLVEACKFHNDGQISANPTIGVCWDADRLDLPRVGIAPDPALLSTQAGKDLLWNI